MTNFYDEVASNFMAALTQTKPPNLKEHLLKKLDHVTYVADTNQETQFAIDDLRRAIEQLPDAE
jgi:hypothetical protein